MDKKKERTAMKRKSKIILAIGILLLAAILFVPFHVSHYDDGGTTQTTALTYSIVHWKKIGEAECYEKTCIYFFPDNFKGIDELWEIRH